MVRVVLAAFLLLFSAAASFLFGLHSNSQIPFDAEVWKRQLDSNKRLQMICDLKPKLMRIGKPEVEQLLGKPVKDFNRRHPDYYYYLLGTQERFLDTDGVWMCLKFQNDHVSDIQVFHD